MFKVTKDDIQTMDKIGRCLKGDIFHVLTKGGFNMIVAKNQAGALEVLGTGPHPYIARHNAEGMEKSIEWDESLMKSESPLFKNPNPPQQPVKAPAESTDANHYKMAMLFSRHASKYPQDKKTGDFVKDHDNTMMYLHNTDRALAHYQMAGLTPDQAHKEHLKNIKLGPTNESAPFDEYELQLAYQKKNNKKAPGGLGYDFSK